MHMIIERRKDLWLAVDAFDLAEQKLRVPPSFTGTLLVLRHPLCLLLRARKAITCTFA